MLTITHVTHEAVQKIGGIGTVLEGLITSAAYGAAVDRTILLAPLFTTEGEADSRLGPDGEVLYSSIDGRTDHAIAEAFQAIRERYGVELVYGRRLLRDPLTGRESRPEVVLVDVGRAEAGAVNDLKGRFFDAYGIASDRYEQSWDFEQYVRLAEPGLAAIRALGASGPNRGCVVVAHEYMGLPTALAAKLRPEWQMRTIYHAHEVGTIRGIVDQSAGHDTMFYNVLRTGKEQGLFVEDIFGDQHGSYRHALVEASRHLDVTLAVGDLVMEELKFLSPDLAASDIRLAYNGIPAYEISADEAATSKSRLQTYVETLLGYRPDHVFTHVTRMTPSKGLWRDLRVMEFIEEAFRREDRTGALIVLSTELCGPRRRDDILHMERWWDWPVAHREGPPDLSGGEALFYAGVQAFNARSQNCKVVYLNQFGFDRGCCGERMPEEMAFWDIRRGSDVEFGQSIYEPFGIAPLEALSFGAVAVMSNVSGGAGFVGKVSGPKGTPNVVVADYTAVDAPNDTVEAYLHMDRARRETVEGRVAAEVAGTLLERLPRTPEAKAEYVRRGYALAEQMSWEVVARDYFLPAVRDICEPGGIAHVA